MAIAEILCIAPRIDADQAHNLARSLTSRIAGGGDPGPRDAQIRSLGRTLARSVRALREELARLGLPETATGLDLDRLERAASLARAYGQPDHRHGDRPTA